MGKVATLFSSLSLASLLACAGGAHRLESPTAQLGPGNEATRAFTDDDRSWGRYRSKRFALTFPLPDGRSWRIDDHSRREVVATHAPTRSQLVVYMWLEPELMNRQKCEARARAIAVAPPETEASATPTLQTVSDETIVGPDAFDTRVWVAIAPGPNEKAPVNGHVFAFGAFVHKCLYFHFASEVPTGKDGVALSDRLAAARARIFAGLKLDDFDSVPRERSQY